MVRQGNNMKYIIGEAKQKRNWKMYHMRKNGNTFEHIGKKFNVTHERVRQIYCKLELVVEYQQEKMAKKILNI